MTNKWNIVIILFSILHAQAQITVTNSDCTVVNTQSVHDVKVTCGGLSESDAKQLVKLMNRMLSDRVDLKTMNSKLDSIGAEISVINVAANPLAHVPPRLLKLYDDAELVYTACSSLHTEWTRLANMPSSGGDKQSNPTSPFISYQLNYVERLSNVRSQYLQEYRRTLLPRLLTLDAKVHRALGQAVSPAASFETPQQPIEVSLIASNLSDLLNLYESRQARAGSPPDLSLHRENDDLIKDCAEFSKNWNAAQSQAMTPPPDQVVQPSEVDILEAKKYHTTIENDLVGLRREAKLLVPGYKSSVDYANIKNSRDLQTACQDIHSIEEAYKRKVTIQVMENASHTQSSKSTTQQ